MEEVPSWKVHAAAEVADALDVGSDSNASSADDIDADEGEEEHT